MKVKRSVRIVNGKNQLTEIDQRKVEKNRKKNQADINKCLNCKKPASKCKGECV